MKGTVLAAGVLSCIIALTTVAAEKPEKASAQTTLDLYATPSETWDVLQKDSSAILVDVRDPVEVMFTGFATPTRIHVPLMIANSKGWNDKKSSWAMEKNPAFNAQLTDKLNQLGANKDTPIFMMCRSGSRSASAVNLLAAQGYSNVWSVVNGFEGGVLKEGDSKGVRAVNGWRNSGLPWSYKVDPPVAWHPAE
ncbi:rhodanese-like domain-containing protein [Amphritea pacifica]|uniref:rhodanese-like domain-containing protein n=1 Tax=Amphritea pacifica TaxID=2811233 RepID=UPI0019644E17|nr:rhodanese-like domain-containing protein [Amphritea pacifica]MBN1006083.1 sulfurtransferase [Amphritea pacifica]